MSIGPSSNHKNSSSTIYIFDNDPTCGGRGSRVSSLRHFENGGGYYPFVTDVKYCDRKFSNLKYNYDDRRDFGKRPFHTSTENGTSFIGDFSTQTQKVGLSLGFG
jgi:hypothetical protein